MKKSLKLISIVIALMLLVTVVTGCGTQNTENSAENGETNQAAQASKELVRGKWEDNVYTNEFANIKFKLPEGWNYSSDEEIAELMNVSVDLLNQDSLAKIAEQTAVYDMVASNPNTGSNVMVMFEKPLTKATVERYISNLKSGLEEVDSINYTISDETSTATVCGREFTVVTATVPDYKMTQKYYIAQEGDYFVDILVTYIDGTNDEATIMNNFE